LSQKLKVSKQKAPHPFDHLSKLQVEYLDIDKLRPSPHNARTHSPQQIRQIERSVTEFGFTNPLLVDGAGLILAGHGRVEAAKRLGFSRVPVIRISHLSIAQKRAYIIADNKLAEKAGWDRDILAIELQGLIDVGFDAELTGFDVPEIEMILDAPDPAADNAAEELIPDIAPTRIITKANDLWILGEHRLLCGDARREGSFATLMGGSRAQLVFVDPPYNVQIRGHVSGKGRIKHREFAQASGEKTSAQFVKFLDDSLGLLAEHSMDGSIHFVCTDWRHLDEMLTAGRRAYRELKNVAVWAKTNAGMGSFYRSQHELILVWKHGRSKHINNIELGKHGRSRSNVWTYAGANTFSAERLTDLAMHPTVKPVALVADAILDCSRRGDLVLDSFGGSGTTLIACERTGRKGRLIEIDPIYCDQTIRRWQGITARHAVNAAGVPFNHLEKASRK
jgi:DNA modification methylase